MSSQLPPPVHRAPPLTDSARYVLLLGSSDFGSCSRFVKSFHGALRASGFWDMKSTEAHLETGPLGANDGICWTKSFLAASLIFLSPLFSRRSNSISKSPGPSSPKEPLLLSRDISRSESLRSSSSCSQQIFRPCDLIHGEVLGKGFFGQAIKVREVPKHSSFTLITATSAYLGILRHCLSGLCPADSDRSWNSPGLFSEIHFSVSFPDHECLWLQAVLILSPLSVNLGHIYSSPELHLELQSACVTATTWVRWGEWETNYAFSYEHLSYEEVHSTPQYGISHLLLVWYAWGFARLM